MYNKWYLQKVFQRFWAWIVFPNCFIWHNIVFTKCEHLFIWYFYGLRNNRKQIDWLTKIRLKKIMKYCILLEQIVLQEIYDFIQNVYHEGCSYAIGLLNIMAVDCLKMNQFQDSLWKQLSKKTKQNKHTFPAVISLRMLVSKVLGNLL